MVLLHYTCSYKQKVIAIFIGYMFQLLLERVRKASWDYNKYMKPFRDQKSGKNEFPVATE